MVIEENGAVNSVGKITPYEKQRKQLAVAFLICGILLVSFIVFAFVSLPKYQTNQNVAYLSKAYDSISDIDYYISVQAQGGRLNEELLKDKILAVTENLKHISGDQASDIRSIWKNFHKQLSEQNITLQTLNDAIQLKLRADNASVSLHNQLVMISQELSESRSVSVETVRYIDQLANSVIRLQSNISRVINSRSQVEIKTIAELTESLTNVQKGLNTLVIGSPADAVQSMKGSLEEERIIESQFIFNQLARDVSHLITDASGIVRLNQMRENLQEEKDKIQNILQTTIDEAYATQQEYIKITNKSVFWISILASVGTVLFFILFAYLFLRLNKSRVSIALEKDDREQRIDEVMLVVEKFVTLRTRLLPQLEILSALNADSDNILQKGRSVRQSSASFSALVKGMESTYDYLEQAFAHDLALLDQDSSSANLEELKATLSNQLKFFTDRKEELMNAKQCSTIIDEFFASVISNTNDSVIAYREVEHELLLIISEIEQLNRDLKE